jgi:signal transduction histidine kinase/DNA-binding response OmpR family regulator/streptogramin lyase
MLEDSIGNLWLGTWSGGLYLIDREKEICKGVYLNTENANKIMHIHSITEYKPGELLIGSNHGLTYFSLSPSTGNVTTVQYDEPFISNQFVYPIYKDKEGGLWIGTYYGGINYASPNRNYFKNYLHKNHENSLNGNVVSRFCEDKNGNLWIGTEDGGLNYFDVKTNKFSVYKPEKRKNSLSYHNIHALCIDGDDVWIGTYSGGLNVLNLKSGKFKYYFYETQDTMSLNTNNIYSLYKDSQNNIWIGTSSGINLYNRQKDNFIRMLQHDRITLDILQQGNTIWFATLGQGLYAYKTDTKEWKNYYYETNATTSLLTNEINCLSLDNDSILWVGTDEGLYRFNSKNEIFELIDADFPNNTIHNIINDNGFLWLTTTKGLIRFDPRSNKFNIYIHKDGMCSDEFMVNSGIKSLSGKIYLGTNIGFFSFNPENITENEYLPALYITNFQLFNKSVNIENYMTTDGKIQELKLPYNKNSFSFEYAALSYFAPEKNEYAYILEGFDEKWNYVGDERKATYTNISPGEYYFKVRASNNDRKWNNDGIIIKLVIIPPFYWNQYSISLYLALLIICLIALLLFQKKRMERKHEQSMNLMMAEQEKEAYNSKINFFTSVSHEIRTPISLIIGPLEKISQNNKDNLPEDVIDNLEIINRNSQRLLSLMNQLLDFRKIEKNIIQICFTKRNLYEFLLGIYDRFRYFVGNKNIEFQYTFDDKDFETLIDEENLTKIVSNVLFNAAKYTMDYIELNLCTNIPVGKYKISVIDNGPGIPEKERTNIFKPFYQIEDSHKSGAGIGLYLVKSIVDILQGEINLADSKDGGLIFSIILPVVENEKPDGKNYPEYINRKEVFLNEDIDADDEKENLLLVEDNPEMQMFLYMNFKDTYHVFLANNGKEGIKVLENSAVDIIISDIVMSEMDGIEFLNNVKNNTLWNHIPFIILTAKTNISSKIEALKIGADAYVEKPFSIQHLSAQINNLIESREKLLKKFTETPFMFLKNMAKDNFDEEFLSKLNDIMEKNISNETFSIEDIAKGMYISTSGLFTKIKSLTGITPNKLLMIVRLKKAAELLHENKYRINEICGMVGFSNPSYFAKSFHKQYGVLPKDYRERKNI